MNYKLYPSLLGKSISAKRFVEINKLKKPRFLTQGDLGTERWFYPEQVIESLLIDKATFANAFVDLMEEIDKGNPLRTIAIQKFLKQINITDPDHLDDIGYGWD